MSGRVKDRLLIVYEIAVSEHTFIFFHLSIFFVGSEINKSHEFVKNSLFIVPRDLDV